MPNNVHKYGFRLHSLVYGTVPKVEVWSVATAQDDQDDSSNSIDLNIGDPLQLVSTGGVGISQNTDAVYGIFAGVKQYWDGTRVRGGTKLPNQTTWGTVEARRSLVYVWRVTQAIWEIDVDDATTFTTRATYQDAVGENCEHTTPGNTSATSADPYLDISTNATTATLGWRIVGISDTAENRYFDGSYVKLLVRCNQVQEPAFAASGSIVAGV